MPTKAKILATPVHRSPIDRKIHIPLEAPVVAVVVPGEHSHEVLGVNERLHERDISARVIATAIDALTCAGIVVVDARLHVRVHADLLLERGHGVHGDVHEREGGDCRPVSRCQRCVGRLEPGYYAGVHVAHVGDRVAGAVELLEEHAAEGIEEPEEEGGSLRLAASH